MIRLSEIIHIHSFERELIIDFVSRLEIMIDIYWPNKSIPLDYHRFKEIINIIDGTDLLQRKYTASISIEMDWYENKWEASFQIIDESKGKYLIKVNLRSFVTPLKKDNEWWITNINYEALRNTIVHEFVHFKQKHWRSTPFKNPFQTKKSYFNRGHEQEAWAAGELEFIRQKIERHVNPNSIGKHMISILKRYGLNSASMITLKQTNFQAWKHIMKRAAMLAKAEIYSADDD